MMARVILKATNARAARLEISRRWPKIDVNYTGYDKHGESVLMSLVRGATKGNVATAHRNRSEKPVKFVAIVPDGMEGATELRDELYHLGKTKEGIEARMRDIEEELNKEGGND